MMEHFKDITAPLSSNKETEKGLIRRGIFIDEERPEYCVEYDRVIEAAGKGGR